MPHSSSLECPRETSRKLLCTRTSTRGCGWHLGFSSMNKSFPLLPGPNWNLHDCVTFSFLYYENTCILLLSWPLFSLPSQSLCVLEHGRLVFYILKWVWSILPAAFQVHMPSFIHSFNRYGLKFGEQRSIQPCPPPPTPSQILLLKWEDKRRLL